MGHLRAPGLGPIVGHTTHESCRIWIRARDPESTGVGMNIRITILAIYGHLYKFLTTFFY